MVDIEVEWIGKGVNERGINRKTGDALVVVSNAYYRAAEVDLLLGDPSKAKEKLGWKPSVDLKGLVEIMIDYDLRYDDYGYPDLVIK